MFQGSSFRRAARSHEMEGRGCEDAAICVGAPDGASMLALVSDGCSSGIDSGLVSNLLARSAAHEWGQASRSLEGIARASWERALGAAKLVGLDACLSPATLLMAKAESMDDSREGFIAEVAMWGDGALAACDAQGALMGFWSAQSELNMPAYPAYAFEDALWRRYQEMGGSTSWEQGILAPEFSTRGAAVVKGLGWVGDARGWGIGLRLPVGWSLSLLSDGVGAVEGISQIEAAKSLCAGRGPGGFAERRARKAIEDWAKSGSRLGDDISIAAIRFDIGE